MKPNLNKKQTIYIAVVVAIGIVIAILILSSQGGTKLHGEDKDEHDGHSHDDHSKNHSEAEPQAGPHGGKLFTQNGYGVEITIFEEGIEPEFRVYTYKKGKPLDPAASKVTITLERLGRTPQKITFVKQNDYLKGNAVVEEPHSFKVTINAQFDNKPYSFAYEQIEARVSMTDQQIKQGNIEMLTSGPARIKSTLQLIGHISFNEDRVVYVVPRLAGVVESVGANAGDPVRKGHVLAVISSQALADLRSELLAAQKRLSLARTTLEREKKLWEEKISAEQDYLQARNVMQEAEIIVQSVKQKLASLGGSLTNTSNLTRYEIRAPIDGIVMQKQISVGQVLKEDANIFVVADLSTVWAVLTIYSNDLNTVKIGQKAIVKASSFDFQSSGSVEHLGALLGEQTRTAEAHIILANPKGIWRPGLPVNIELVADEVEVPVAVSADAIQTVRDWTAVFVRYGTFFEAHPLELGRSDGKFIEVVKGLNAGERYAAKNSFLIKADLGKAGASHDH
ncbi:efflux RND transporter periplasmic adaptor subunit [Candidatus Nitrotoga sp. AM1P]|uniref:efflux RND transporter periplasmic adaptor subunit n=1 Tax=Candidatus Nitrotoga sp. AM1P TaxID=2559597 RepID=UPI0010B7BD6A|nr:efflux RND transporter periplasmic adaptor subunit [Candidatus Nitrotoga sp. AM1P]BBJ24708.1 efflux RND transporter periplasmic adaptor subunit [Candidatus Nitrotoga sp. AM1P]